MMEATQKTTTKPTHTELMKATMAERNAAEILLSKVFDGTDTELWVVSPFILLLSPFTRYLKYVGPSN